MNIFFGTKKIFVLFTGHITVCSLSLKGEAPVLLFHLVIFNLRICKVNLLYKVFKYNLT